MSEHYTTHASLLARISGDGDPAAWHEFCVRYGQLIRGFARRRGLQAADIDDLMQEVLMALTKSMPDFRYDPAKGKFRSYLKTLVVRAINRKRFQKRGEVALEDIGGADDAACEDESADMVWEQEWRQYHISQATCTIVAEFNEGDREAFQQYAVAGRGAAETAASLGLSVDQVYQAKSRILKRLGELIERQMELEG